MKRVIIPPVILSLIGLIPVLPRLCGQEAALACTARAQAVGVPSPGQQVEKTWPRSYTAPSGAKIVIYQPQAASWDDQKRLVGYAAVSYQPAGQEKHSMGSLKIEANTSVSLQERLVKFSVIKITEANFPSLSKEQTRDIVSEIEKTIP